MMCLKRLWKLFPITWCEIMILTVVIITLAFPTYGEIQGDFNGDGFSDLAIGVPFEDITVGTTTVTDAGAVQVLYGSLDGLQAHGVNGPDDQFWSQNSFGVGDTAEGGDNFGMALTETHEDGNLPQ